MHSIPGPGREAKMAWDIGWSLVGVMHGHVHGSPSEDRPIRLDSSLTANLRYDSANDADGLISHG